MRESADTSPAIDLSEFERRLRSGDPAPKRAVDPLAELARLMQGGEEPAAVDHFERLLGARPEEAQHPHPAPAPEWPGEAPAAGGEPAAVDPNEWMSRAFGAAPEAPRAEPAPEWARDDFGGWFGEPQGVAAPPIAIDEHMFDAELRGSLGAPAAPEPAAAPGPGAGGYAAAFDPHLQPYGEASAHAAAHENFEHAGQEHAGVEHAGVERAGVERASYEHDGRADAGYEHDGFEEEYVEGAYYAEQTAPLHDQAAQWPDGDAYLDYAVADPAAAQPTPRGGILSKFRPWHAVVGVAALGVASIGWGFAHRSGALGSRELATIAAPEGPTKVQPQADADADSSGQGATVLDRNETTPVKSVVTHEEQPIEPHLAPKIASSLDDLDRGQPAPKRVKTVSVRPDGTVIEAGDAPSAVMKAAAPPPAGKQPAAGAAKGAATPKAAAKSATPHGDKPAKPKEAAKPAKIANAAPQDDAAAPEAEADAPAADKPAAKINAGGYAVQFGAAATEEEARSLMSRVAGKYGSQLGGHRPTFKVAKVGDKTVYRVRVGGVSKESAVSLCERVKTGGGSCFVAGN